MRSLIEDPSNPWPHDMLIRVEDPHHILTLLFLRRAWLLPVAADLPELDPEPDPGAVAIPDTATATEWAARWEEAWQRAWDWYGLEGAGTLRPSPETLASLGPGAPLIPEFPPLWEVEHGDAGLDREAFARWTSSMRDDHRRPLAEHPERVCLPALIPAWRAGVDSILVLPFRGYFARRVGRNHLAVSRTTRNDPELYTRALESAVA